MSNYSSIMEYLAFDFFGLHHLTLSVCMFTTDQVFVSCYLFICAQAFVAVPRKNASVMKIKCQKLAKFGHAYLKSSFTSANKYFE